MRIDEKPLESIFVGMWKCWTEPTDQHNETFRRRNKSQNNQNHKTFYSYTESHTFAATVRWLLFGFCQRNGENNGLAHDATAPGAVNKSVQHRTIGMPMNGCVHIYGRCRNKSASHRNVCFTISTGTRKIILITPIKCEALCILSHLSVFLYRIPFYGRRLGATATTAVAKQSVNYYVN